jgi:hypothetical protein
MATTLAQINLLRAATLLFMLTGVASAAERRSVSRKRTEARRRLRVARRYGQDDKDQGLPWQGRSA